MESLWGPSQEKCQIHAVQLPVSGTSHTREPHPRAPGIEFKHMDNELQNLSPSYVSSVVYGIRGVELALRFALSLCEMGRAWPAGQKD